MMDVFVLNVIQMNEILLYLPLIVHVIPYVLRSATCAEEKIYR